MHQDATAWLLDAFRVAGWDAIPRVAGSFPATRRGRAGVAFQVGPRSWVLACRERDGMRPVAWLEVGSLAVPPAEARRVPDDLRLWMSGPLADDHPVVQVMAPARVRIWCCGEAGPVRPGLHSPAGIRGEQRPAFGSPGDLPPAVKATFEAWRSSPESRQFSHVAGAEQRVHLMAAAAASAVAGGQRVLLMVPMPLQVAALSRAVSLQSPDAVLAEVGAGHVLESASVVIGTFDAVHAWMFGPEVPPVPVDAFALVMGAGSEMCGKHESQTWKVMASALDARFWGLVAPCTMRLPDDWTLGPSLSRGAAISESGLVPLSLAREADGSCAAAAVAAVQELMGRVGRDLAPKTLVVAGRAAEEFTDAFGTWLGPDTVAQVSRSYFGSKSAIQNFRVAGDPRVIVVGRDLPLDSDFAACELLVVASEVSARSVMALVDACSGVLPGWLARDVSPGLAPKERLVVLPMQGVVLPDELVDMAVGDPLLAGPEATSTRPSRQRPAAPEPQSLSLPTDLLGLRSWWLAELASFADENGGVEQADLSMAPFCLAGGRSAAQWLFGMDLPRILVELSTRSRSRDADGAR